jgi:hypothetical protein
MSPRRLALTLVVALVAVTGAVGASAARASSPICVALVVDAHTLGAGVSTSCATVPKGASGVDVLQAAGHRIGYRSDGLICTLDGLPRGGCDAVDSSHYWAYFHRAPGSTSWTYSTEGPSTYQPANTSTEGWVWDDGSPLTPKNVPYSRICRPKPTPSPSAGHRHHPQPVGASRPHQHPTAQPSGTPRPTASATSNGAAVRDGHAHQRHQHQRPRPHTSASQRRTTVLPSPSPTPAALAGGARPSAQHHGLLDLLIGAAVLMLLGGLAALRFRQSKR